MRLSRLQVRVTRASHVARALSRVCGGVQRISRALVVRRALLYSLVDMMNLARTRLILGSGYSSYSEVAAHMGGARGKPLPILMAGRDFGKLVARWGARRPLPTPPSHHSGALSDRDFVPELRPVVQHYWPKPF